jgi:hypothetical protein
MLVHGINFDHVRIAEVCRAHGVKRLAVFGSVLRDDFGPDSDIDVLVEFLPGHDLGPWLSELTGLKADLESLWGRQIDVVMRAGVHPLLRDYVERVAWVQYAA